VTRSRRGSTGAMAMTNQARQNAAVRPPRTGGEGEQREGEQRYRRGISHLGSGIGAQNSHGPTDQAQYLASVRSIAPVKWRV
jgi:hypothetical protein